MDKPKHELEILIMDALARLNKTRKGSAEYEMVIRQLTGLRDRIELLSGHYSDLA